MTEKKKRNIIIGLLCGVLLLMVVGYAAFNSVLKIKGTSNISSNWDIKITNITAKNMTGTAKDIPYDAENQTDGTRIDLENPLSATFKTELETPGDSIEYDITVSNEGTINAKLETINLIDTNNGAIRFEARGLEEGDSLKTGENKILTVKVEYLNGAILDENNMSSTLKVELTFSQANVDKDGIAYPDDNAAGVLRGKAVTTGDGLYEDEYEAGRYVYRGTNPDNYITFNNATWRIISVESDNTLKIINNESVGQIQWDERNARPDSTYCVVDAYGCNAWAATANLVNTPSDFTLHYPNGNPTTDTTKYSGTVTKNSTLNTYLNNTYYNSLNEDKQYIENHNFNVGTPGNFTDTEGIATDIQQEALYKWNGKVGLMNVTEVLRTTSNTTCTNLKEGYYNNSTGYCSSNNWMWGTSGREWTISPLVHNDSNHIFTMEKSARDLGRLGSNDGVGTDINVRPVVYLTSSILLEGKGTLDEPYTIVSK